jgi:hypothetical protein
MGPEPYRKPLPDMPKRRLVLPEEGGPLEDDPGDYRRSSWKVMVKLMLKLVKCSSHCMSLFL